MNSDLGPPPHLRCEEIIAGALGEGLDHAAALRRYAGELRDYARRLAACHARLPRRQRRAGAQSLGRAVGRYEAEARTVEARAEELGRFVDNLDGGHAEFENAVADIFGEQPAPQEEA